MPSPTLAKTLWERFLNDHLIEAKIYERSGKIEFIGDETMAVIKCPECGKEISDKAMTCPHCGYPLMSDRFEKAGKEIRRYTISRIGLRAISLVIEAVFSALLLLILYKNMPSIMEKMPSFEQVEELLLKVLEKKRKEK